MHRLRFFGTLGATCILASSVYAVDAGTYDAYLESIDGDRIKLAQIQSHDDGRYSLTLDEESFSDHFLSMRPFKCLEGPNKHWCHVPYPYKINRRVSSNDFTDLEYDFLFVWKGATEYGINMWNGVYYRLTETDGTLVGQIHEMDMGLLAVPPDEGELRPISEYDLEESDPESHWLPRLVIEQAN